MLNNTPFEAAYLFSIKVYKIYPQINFKSCLATKSTKLPLLVILTFLTWKVSFISLEESRKDEFLMDRWSGGQHYHLLRATQDKRIDPKAPNRNITADIDEGIMANIKRIDSSNSMSRKKFLLSEGEGLQEF